MLSNELFPHTLNITNAPMISVKSARLKYQSHQEELKESQNKDEDHNARKIVNDEINDVKSKIDTLKDVCSKLEKEFVDSVAEAKFQHDMSLVVKASCIKEKVY